MALGGAAIGVLASGSAGAQPAAPQLPYEAGQPVPPGYHVATELREGLLIAGGVLFWAGYIPSSVIASTQSGRHCADRVGASQASDCLEVSRYVILDVPLAGPFIGIGTLHPGVGAAIGLAALGAVQVTGAVMVVVGLAAPRRTLRRDVARIRGVTPVVGSGAAGLCVVGSF